MSNPLTDVRRAIFERLVAADLGVTVHMYRPASVNGPCVVLDGGDPWLSERGHVSIDVVVYAATTSTQGAMARLEQLCWDVQQALSGYVGWGPFGKPQYDATAQLTFTTIPTITRP